MENPVGSYSFPKSLRFELGLKSFHYQSPAASTQSWFAFAAPSPVHCCCREREDGGEKYMAITCCPFLSILGPMGDGMRGDTAVLSSPHAEDTGRSIFAEWERGQPLEEKTVLSAA